MNDIISPNDINIAQDELFKTIELLCERYMKNMNKADETIECQIIDASKAKNHIYTVVTSNNVKLDVQSENTEYKVDDKVQVLIPQGNYNAVKRIIGKCYDENTTQNMASENIYFHLLTSRDVAQEYTITNESQLIVSSWSDLNIPPSIINALQFQCVLTTEVQTGTYWLEVTNSAGDISIFKDWPGNYLNYEHALIKQNISLPFAERIFNNIRLCVSEDFVGTIIMDKNSTWAVGVNRDKPFYIYNNREVTINNADINYTTTQLWLSAIAPISRIVGTVSGYVLDSHKNQYLPDSSLHYGEIPLYSELKYQTEDLWNTQIIRPITLYNGYCNADADMIMETDKRMGPMRWLKVHPIAPVSKIQFKDEIDTMRYGVQFNWENNETTILNPTFFTILKYEAPYDTTIYLAQQSDNGLWTILQSYNIVATNGSAQYFFIQEKLHRDLENSVGLFAPPTYALYPSDARVIIELIDKCTIVLNGKELSWRPTSSSDGTFILTAAQGDEIQVRCTWISVTMTTANSSQSITGRLTIDWHFRKLDTEYDYEYSVIPTGRFTYTPGGVGACVGAPCSVVVYDAPYRQFSENLALKIARLKNNPNAMLEITADATDLQRDATQGFSIASPVIVGTNWPQYKLITPEGFNVNDLSTTPINYEQKEQLWVEWWHYNDTLNTWYQLPFDPTTAWKSNNLFDLSTRPRFLQDGYGQFKAIVYIDGVAYESNILTIDAPKEE